MKLRRLIDWWSDLLSVLADPQILIAVITAAGMLAVAALIVYSVRRWRAEKVLIEGELRDAIARIHRYATACLESDSSPLADRRREYLAAAVARWLRVCHGRWTDFQSFLALRALRNFQPRTRWNAQLGAGLTEALLETGNPRMNLASAVLNNGLATLFRMRPAPARVPMTLSDDAIPSYAAFEERLELSSVSDPFVVEDDVIAALAKRGPNWLHDVLHTAERRNGHRRLAPRDDGARAIMAEAVVWIVHEERIGPAPLPRELLRVYEISWQLLEHVPQWLRESSVALVQHLGTSQLLVVLGSAPLPREMAFDGGLLFPVPLEIEGELWRFVRIEFDVTGDTAQLFFRAQRRRRSPPAAV